MTIFSLTDALNALFMTLLMLFFSFSLYLPLLVLLKDSQDAKRSVIPTSFSFLIVIGYFFYCTAYFHYFLVSYGALLLAINAFSFFWLRKKHYFKKRTLTKQDRWWFFGFTLVIAVLLYNRFFDSVTNIAPGTIDTFNHLLFVKDLSSESFLRGAIYPPGFHLLVFPFSEIFAWKYIYRFIGPALGIVFFLQMYFLAQDLQGEKNQKKDNIYGKMIIISLLLLPFLNAFYLQTMGFFATSLVIIFFVYWALLICQNKIDNVPLWLLALQAVALGVTAPHYLIMFLISIVVLWVFYLVFKRRIYFISKKNLYNGLFVPLLGLLTGFLHVIIQTLILHRGSAEFPTIESVKGVGDALVVGNNLSYEYQFMSAFGKHYIAPILGTAVDLLSIKNIRGLDDAMAIGGYLVLAFALIMIIYCYVKKKKNLITLFVLLLVYGFSVQTGFGEMSTYRGRSGYMFFALTIFLVALGYNLYMNERAKKMIYFVLPIILVLALVFPPRYYRINRVETYLPVYRLSMEYAHTPIAVYANDRELAVLSDNIKVYPLSVENIEKCNSDICVIIIEDFFVPDPSVSQQALPGDVEYKNYYAQQNILAQEREVINNKIRASVFYRRFRTYYKSTDVEVVVYRQGY